MLGHSWGTMVAVSLALQAPDLVRSLVLLSGYYFPTARLDVALNTPLAVPGIGDAMRHTFPAAGSAHAAGRHSGDVRPAPVPERFDRLFPKALMVRPIQLRASAEDAALMTPSVMELEQHYRELKMPVVILTGGDDKIVDVDRQSRRLHEEIPQSEFDRSSGSRPHGPSPCARSGHQSHRPRGPSGARGLSRPARSGSSSCS